ncbi:MAG TPA: PDZ domain-containing protein [Acidimicrobiia bacterium]
MRRILILGVAGALLTACLGQSPPDREPLPDAGDVVPEPQACSFLIGEGTGVNVDDVIADTGAEGVLQVGDRLIRVDDAEISNADQLRAVLAERAVGDSVNVAVMRDGDEVAADIVLGANPDSPDRPLLGILVETAFERVEATDLVSEPAGGPLSRAASIGAGMYVVDPQTGGWGTIGIDTPAEQWAAAGPYVLTLVNRGTEESALLDEISGDRLVIDVGGWRGDGILGTFGSSVIVAASRPLESDDAFVEIALLSISFEDRAANWIWQAAPAVGRPVISYPSPDGSRLLVVNQGQEDDLLRHVILSSEGQLTTPATELSSADGVLALGWFDDRSVLLRQSTGQLELLEVTSNITSALEMPAALGTPQRIWPVGDGQHVLASTGTNLLQVDLTAATEVRTLADHCLVDALGDIGWTG